jgi:hypothetical protein
VKTLTKTRLAGLLLLAACNKDTDAGFTTLAELCSEYTEAVCDGRDNCCEDVDRDVCEKQVLKACKAAHADLVEEKGLSYSGERAFKALQAMRDAQLSCEPPYVLSQFFEGGLADGESCARATQCKSFSCGLSESRLVCLPAAAAELCEPEND